MVLCVFVWLLSPRLISVVQSLSLPPPPTLKFNLNFKNRFGKKKRYDLDVILSYCTDCIDTLKKKREREGTQNPCFVLLNVFLQNVVCQYFWLGSLTSVLLE